MMIAEVLFMTMKNPVLPTAMQTFAKIRNGDYYYANEYRGQSHLPYRGRIQRTKPRYCRICRLSGELALMKYSG